MPGVTEFRTTSFGSDANRYHKGCSFIKWTGCVELARLDREQKRKEKNDMAELKKYVCGPCGYEYDPEVGDPDNGIAPGTAFEDLPEDWVCPVCGLGKDVFEPED